MRWSGRTALLGPQTQVRQGDNVLIDWTLLLICPEPAWSIRKDPDAGWALRL